jgi:membrane-anchored mycosin MYCP
MTGRTAPMIAILLLIAAPVLTAAPAIAVGPPPIDPRLLPQAGPAGSRYPTEQFATCATAPVAVTGARHESPDLRSAWVRTRGAGQTVAVIDTGVARHRLLPHLVPGGDYVAHGDGTADCDGHGTVVAGIIGAAPDPASGFSGIAPDAAVLAIRQSSMKFRASDAAGGDGVGDVESLAAAVRAATDQGATVINISSVACLAVADTLDDRALGAALAYAVDTRNVVVVAAAGNVGGQGTCPKQNPLPDPPAGPDWDRVDVVASPSWYDDYVLTVGSVDADGTPSGFTLAGPWVDVAAPAEAVISLNPSGEGLADTMPGAAEPQPISGTSYAAPVVSGVAALLRAAAPNLTARQVMHRIESTARGSGWNPLVGHGVVDVLAALRGIAAPVTPGAPHPLAPPSTVVADAEPQRFALIGAAVCAVLAAASAALRSRRRADAVPHDSGTSDAELGPAR